MELGKLRKKKNLNQKELAEKLGVHRVTVARYEGGTRVPSLKTIEKIAKILDTSTEQVIQAILCAERRKNAK